MISLGGLPGNHENFYDSFLCDEHTVKFFFSFCFFNSIKNIHHNKIYSKTYGKNKCLYNIKLINSKDRMESYIIFI